MKNLLTLVIVALSTLTHAQKGVVFPEIISIRFFYWATKIIAASIVKIKNLLTTPLSLMQVSE